MIIELCDQPVARQGPSPSGGVLGASPGRPVHGVRHRRARVARPEVRSSVEAWIGCVAGALEEDDYRSLLAEAGFADIDIESTRDYRLADVAHLLEASGIDPHDVASAEGHVYSAFVRATKPEAD